MGLERYLSRISTVMAPAFADAEPWSYEHVDTGTTHDVVAFLKHKSTENDPIDGPTKRQKVPVIRAKDLPWPEAELVGDTITSPDGNRWYVTDADTRPSGWTDLFVTDRGSG